jgi:hypothetical protein
MSPGWIFEILIWYNIKYLLNTHKNPNKKNKITFIHYYKKNPILKLNPSIKVQIYEVK